MSHTTRQRMTQEQEDSLRDRFYARGASGLTDEDIITLFAHLNAQAAESGDLLDEVYALRAVCARASLLLSQALPQSTSKAARERVMTARDELERSAAGQVSAVWQQRTGGPDMKRALEFAGAPTFLNLPAWRVEQAAREPSEAELQELADEAERGYPIESIRDTCRVHRHAHPSQEYKPSELQAHVEGVHPAHAVRELLAIEPKLGIVELHERLHKTDTGHIRGCQALQGIGLPCTCNAPGRVGDIAGDAPCSNCGRDNRNGTHTALEMTGHLSHEYQPPS